MDFKIAGTRNGITAIQLDIKPAGIPLDIICESLEPALKGRLQIPDHMEREINAARTDDDRNSPRLGIVVTSTVSLQSESVLLTQFVFLITATLKYNNDSIRRLVGPLGALKRAIEVETGTVKT